MILESNCCLDKSNEVIGYKNVGLLEFIALLQGVPVAWLLQAERDLIDKMLHC